MYNSPATPAGKVFAAWLAAFNSADAAQLRAFDAAFPRQGPTPPVEDGEEADQDLSSWNVPTWQELIASLYRPQDR